MRASGWAGDGIARSATGRQTVNWRTRSVQAVALSLALVALGAGDAGGQQAPLTREVFVAAAERAPGPTKGRDQAPITIVEFSDFQCSYCRKFWAETLPKLEAAYVTTGKVRFVYRHLVVLGPASQRAAEAAECAGEQGKFWAFHDALFERAGRVPDAQAMQQMRLDVAGFDACVGSGRHRERIAGESAVARGLGATGTPAFLINGKLLIGAHPFDTFKQILDGLVKELSGMPSAAPGAASRP